MLSRLRFNTAPSELLSGKGESCKFQRAQNSTLNSRNSTLNKAPLSKLHTVRSSTLNSVHSSAALANLPPLCYNFRIKPDTEESLLWKQDPMCPGS